MIITAVLALLVLYSRRRVRHRTGTVLEHIPLGVMYVMKYRYAPDTSLNRIRTVHRGQQAQARGRACEAGIGGRQAGRHSDADARREL